jgi:hypothetical protein
MKQWNCRMIKLLWQAYMKSSFLALFMPISFSQEPSCVEGERSGRVRTTGTEENVKIYERIVL